jgi:hypothetical protein
MQILRNKLVAVESTGVFMDVSKQEIFSYDRSDKNQVIVKSFAKQKSIALSRSVIHQVSRRPHQHGASHNWESSAEELLWAIVIYCDYEWMYKEGVNKSNHAIQNLLLLVTQS